MSRSSNLTIRPAVDQDRQSLANLIHCELHVHRHLDWRPPLDWAGHQPYLIAEHRGKLVAALICPPDPPEIAWIRLFASTSELPVQEAWQALWPAALHELRQQGSPQVAAIPLHAWFCNMLEHSHFSHSNEVVILLWERGTFMPPPNELHLILRNITADDFPCIRAVDAAAFGPLWSDSENSLRYAYQQATLATLVEDESGILGYQISTPGPMGAHLARLAVHPRAQGRGIGYLLTHDLLRQFEQRGLLHVTVNTQQDNQASLALYEKAGFRRTGEKYPVYQINLQ
jgi:ribosomal-protein-alanine N-acetyltransferase